MQKATPSKSKHQQIVLDEKILVVKKSILFSYQATSGLTSIDFNSYQKLIQKYKKFMKRSKMEQNPTYKQIIPYLIFTNDGRYFVMKRKSTASETRLQNKYSIGIGGHIRKEDLKRTNIIDWAYREFDEEVEYEGSYKVKSLGILNDESNPVGQVHTGFVFLLHGDSEKINIKDEHKEGYLLTLDECFELYNQMESWSQIVLDYLRNQFK